MVSALLKLATKTCDINMLITREKTVFDCFIIYSLMIIRRKRSENQQKRDIYKMDRANENGYTVIRILQVDVYGNLSNCLEKLRKNIKIYKTPSRVYIGDRPEFDCFK